MVQSKRLSRHQRRVSQAYSLSSTFYPVSGVEGSPKAQCNSWLFRRFSIHQLESRNRPSTGRKHRGHGANGSTGTKPTCPQVMDRCSKEANNELPDHPVSANRTKKELVTWICLVSTSSSLYMNFDGKVARTHLIRPLAGHVQLRELWITSYSLSPVLVKLCPSPSVPISIPILSVPSESHGSSHVLHLLFRHSLTSFLSESSVPL